MIKISESLEWVGERLGQVSDTPYLDAQVILAHVLDKPRTWILAHTRTHLSDPQYATVKEIVARLEQGESFPHVLGHWEFFGLDLDVTPDVLIPRPETELLVEKAIAWLQAYPERRNVADIGTGSGAIAVTLAIHIHDVRILATDISPAALEVAKHNAQKFHVHHQIEFVECDLLPRSHWERGAGMRTAFDLICANLPYIPTKTLQHLPIYGREPTIALNGGEDGLELYRRLLPLASEWLAPNGLMLFEIENTQGIQALSLASDMFSEATIQLHQDLAGHDRLLEVLLR